MYVFVVICCVVCGVCVVVSDGVGVEVFVVGGVVGVCLVVLLLLLMTLMIMLLFVLIMFMFMMMLFTMMIIL